jgi:3-oxoacyl-[acyl-carrier-protein] synthase-3
MQEGREHAQILSFAGYLPEKSVETTSFAALGDLPASIDFTRLTGILSHKEASPDEGSFELAVKAGKKALDRSNIPPGSIDLVISCSVSQLSPELHQHISPSFATGIARSIGAINAQTFDVANACSSMMTGLKIAEARIRSGKIRNALVVSGEHITSLIDEAKSKNLWIHNKAIASLTVGDGAAAYVIGQSKTPRRIVFSEAFTFAQYNKHCIGEASRNRAGPRMRTSAKQLQMGVLDNLSEFLKRSMSHMDLEWSDIDHVYSHPTTPKAVLKGAKIAEESVGEIKLLHNDSHDTGNTASTSHGVLLEKSNQAGHLKSNETAILVSFGSGLAMLAMHFHLPEGVEQWS